ncbi:MAG: ADP-glyceromanno-heptose 6-epimerase [Halobacteriovoraceae bacterium]|jgi:ADP-L-glycero-D-manno-heptose 6-epimerase|nr:ADP-glyceromanno-heptose 6-epimerase [Halobacteriovoraceae bacterium]
MYIVTGAAGFIGSCIVKKLNDQGIENILVVDRLESDQKWLNLRGVKFQEYVHADEFILPDILESVFEEGVTQIYHMGACSTTTETNVDYIMKNNVEYSQILYRYCATYDVPICYASSAATYGGGEHGFIDEENDLEKLQPLNPYGWSKQLMDEWVIKQLKRPSKWYGVKFFNVYGANEYHKGGQKSVVSHAFDQITESGVMKLFKSYQEEYKDGEQLRDFVYVKDIVDGMWDLMSTEHNGVNGIYNMGTGVARSFKDLVEATFKAMDQKSQIEYIEMPANIKNQYQYFTQAKMEKFKFALPNFKFHNLEDGVTDYVKNYLMQENPFIRSR